MKQDANKPVHLESDIDRKREEAAEQKYAHDTALGEAVNGETASTVAERAKELQGDRPTERNDQTSTVEGRKLGDEAGKTQPELDKLHGNVSRQPGDVPENEAEKEHTNENKNA